MATGLENNVLMYKLFGDVLPKEGGDPTKKNPPVDDSVKFANFSGTTNRQEMAKELGNLGLKGAEQIQYDNPDPNNPDSVKHSQGDWKLAAIQKILQQAYKKGIKTPEEVMANKDYLMSGLDEPYKDAINNKTFNDIHPNFWQFLGQTLIPQQWKKFDAQSQSIAQK